MLVSEMRAEANELAERLVAVAFERQPVNPGAVLLALEMVRTHTVDFVEDADLPQEDKWRFWDDIEIQLQALRDAREARRS